MVESAGATATTPVMRRWWVIAGMALLATISLVAGVFVGYRLGDRTPGGVAKDLAADFAELTPRLHGVAGISVAAVGSRDDPITLGEWRSGAAWSTIKVPVVMAALREQTPHAVNAAMTAAITDSDNTAAETVWEAFGDPTVAARRVDALLREYGDPTVVQSRRIRPEFSASGQTEWPLAAQASFTSTAYCDEANAPVFALMDHIAPDQTWGIGTIADARYKGGWGPALDGSYLVRQLGVLEGPKGLTAVALAVQPDSGRFSDGTADLTEMARWVRAHLAVLPAGRCRG